MPFVRAAETSPVTAPPGAPPIVILPGFGNESTDYTLPFNCTTSGLASVLTRRGFSVSVVQLVRKDWVQVARAAFTIGFWRQSLTTNPGYDWYLRRVATAVAEARDASGSDQVILVGHSAGGWLARAFLGDPRWAADVEPSPNVQEGVVQRPHPAVRMVVTLGTPHAAPAPGTVRDVTGGALKWLNETYPGAAFVEQGVDYVCVAGRTVTGRKRTDKNAPRTLSSYAHDAYLQVSGAGEGVTGDCVVPTTSAMLDGADNIEIEGVLHSMSKVGTFEEKEKDQVWYGSEKVVDLWLGTVISKLGNTAAEAGLPAGEPQDAIAAL